MKKTNTLLLPIYFLWVIVLMPKTVQLIIYVAFVFLLLRHFELKAKKDTFITLQIINMVVFGLSIVINLFNYHEASRIMAAFNTYFINVCALIFYSIYKNNIRYINIPALKKACMLNAAVLVLLFILYKSGISLAFPSIIGKTISGADWLSGIYSPRFLGYLDYANAVVLFVLLLYPFAIRAIRRKSIVLVFSVFLWLTVIGTNSRTGLILFSALTAFAVLSYDEKNFRFLIRNKKTIIFFSAILLILLSILFYSSIYDRLSLLFESRTDSNGMRSLIYQESISKMINDSPFIGKGIKDLIYPYNYPYGSHSTYIGQLYRSGIIGGAIYLLSVLYIVKEIVKRKLKDNNDLLHRLSIICIFVFMIFEDIDGTNWGISLFYISLGLFSGSSGKELKNETI